MAIGHYILDDDGQPVEVDLLTWAHWFEDAHHRQVARTNLASGGYVSTVFMGLDHRFGGDGPPILWETMSFETPGQEQVQERYTSQADALVGHARIVADLSGAS